MQGIYKNKFIDFQWNSNILRDFLLVSEVEFIYGKLVDILYVAVIRQFCPWYLYTMVTQNMSRTHERKIDIFVEKKSD